MPSSAASGDQHRLGRSETNPSQSLVSEEDSVARAAVRNLDETRAISQTMYLEAQAGLLKRRHQGKTVRAWHIDGTNRLEKILKEAEAACSKAVPDFALSTKPARTNSVVRKTSVCALW